MGVFRAFASMVLVLAATFVSAQECVSTIGLISTDRDEPRLVAGPIAWSGLALAVASTEAGSGAVWVTIFGEQSNTLVAPRKVTGSTDSGALALLWNGLELGLFYRTGTNLNLQRLTALGEPIGGPQVITPGRRYRAGDRVAIAWNPAGDAWVIARTAQQGTGEAVITSIVNRDGSTRLTTDVLGFTTTEPDLRVAVTDSGVVGIFFEFESSGALMFARLVGNDTAPSLQQLISTSQDAVVVSHDNLFVIAWTRSFSDHTEIHWMVTDSSGQVVRPAGLLVRGTGVDVKPLALTASEDELGLAYLDSDIGFAVDNGSYRLRRFLIDGTVLSDTVSDLGQTRIGSPFPFVFTGTAYFAAPVRAPIQTGGERRSFLVRICPLRTAIDTEKRLARVNELLTFRADTSGGTPEYKYVWNFGDRTPTTTGPLVQHRYDDPGTYIVTLTVTDSLGATFTHSTTVQVTRGKQRSVRK